MIYTATHVNELIDEKIKIGLLKDLKKTTDHILMVESHYDAHELVGIFMRKMNHLDTPDITFGFIHRRVYVWYKSMDETIKAIEAVSYEKKGKTPRNVLIKKVMKLFTNLNFVLDYAHGDWVYKNAGPKERAEMVPDSLGPFRSKQDIMDWCDRITYMTSLANREKTTILARAEKEIFHKPGMEDSIIADAWNMRIAQEVTMA